MTRTGPGVVAVPACRRTPPRRPARPALTRPSSREPALARPAPGAPATARAVFPGEESFKPGLGRLAARPGRLHLTGQLTRHQRIGAPGLPCFRLPAHPLYLYQLKRPAVAPSGCSFDPGRDMLCILTSPPRWLQWP
jgi:hypothetical protein